jgi:hypothetical protein
MVCRNIISSVSYGREKLFSHVKGKYGMTVLESKVLRKVLGYKMDDVTGDETIDTPRNCLL